VHLPEPILRKVEVTRLKSGRARPPGRKDCVRVKGSFSPAGGTSGRLDFVKALGRNRGKYGLISEPVFYIVVFEMSAQKKITGLGMFLLRCLFWLTTLLVLLPPAAEGDPAPRVNLLHAALAARILVEDVTGVCERNAEACNTSKEALALVARKIETGADIVVAGIAAGGSDPAAAEADHGTLMETDLQPAWSLAPARP
jgi:hypothetical protein